MSSQVDYIKIKKFFKVVNRFMLWMWHMGLGPMVNFWPAGVGRIMVLTHTGRKSGVRRETPANYSIIDGDVYCTTLHMSDWYHNIRVNPQVEVWLPGGRWAGKASEIPNDQTNISILRQILIDSGFAASTFGGIHPRRSTDAELLEKCRDYRILHIQREEALG